jgi:cytochrome c biogenesis protein CcmG/thiol:disulfide interchange protein DsbE
MMKILTVLCLSLVCVIVSEGCGTAYPLTTATTLPVITIAEGNQIGNLALDFQLQNLNGQSVSLSGFRGKPIILNFWATWCGPCRGEMPFLQQIYETWSDKGLVVLEIDLRENATLVQKFMTDSKLSLPTLLDTSGKVGQSYGITVIPTTFFIDKDGIIRQVVRGAFPNKASIESQLSKITP